MTWHSQRALCSLLWSGCYYSMRGVRHSRSDVLDERRATYVFNVCGCLRRVGHAKQVGRAKRVGYADWRVVHTNALINFLFISSNIHCLSSHIHFFSFFSFFSSYCLFSFSFPCLTFLVFLLGFPAHP